MITSSRTERTTALTDLLLCFLTVYIFLQFTDVSGFKFQVWASAFLLLAGATFLGFVVHGFTMVQKTNDLIWALIRLCLGLGFGCILVGAVCDLTGEQGGRRVLPFVLEAIVLSVTAIVLAPRRMRSFLVILFQAIAILLALAVLGIYIFLTINRLLTGSGWMAAGIAVTLLAAVIQATGKKGVPIFWSFDSNGVFHLFQMAGLILLMIGLKMSL